MTVRPGTLARWIVLAVIIFVVFVPMYWILVTSFKTGRQILLSQNVYVPQPFTLDNPGSALAVSGAIALTLLIAVAAFLKRRIVLGAVGLFVVPVGLVAALRLAHPTSPWAHWFYPAGSSRLRRAQERFDDPSRLGARLSCRLMDMVGGRPTDTNSG